MQLTREERETVLRFDEASPTATVYTYNVSLMRRLGLLSRKFPSEFKLTQQDDTGAVTYEIPKKMISIRQPVSEEQKQAARERALRLGIKPGDPRTDNC